MSNTIVIDEDYRIEVDAMNTMLKYKKVSYDEVKKKNVTSKDHWYYQSVNQVLKKYCDLKIGESDSIEELISKIEELHTKVDSLKI